MPSWCLLLPGPELTCLAIKAQLKFHFLEVRGTHLLPMLHAFSGLPDHLVTTSARPLLFCSTHLFPVCLTQRLSSSLKEIVLLISESTVHGYKIPGA